MIQEEHPLRFTHNLQENAQKKHAPLRVLFELTYDCNFDCIHCYVPACRRKIKTLRTKDIFLILDQLQALGCFYLGLSGGEIFLRKDILEILWYAKKKGLNLVLLTNGSLINRSIADEIEKIAPNKVDITLHSLNRSRFEAISRAKGSFKKVIRAIEMLHRRKVPLGIKNCSLAVNQRDLPDVKEFAERLGAVARVGAGVISSSQDLCSLDASQETLLMQGGIPLSRNRQRSDVPHLFPCRAGTYSVVINPEGRLKLCPHIDYPLLRTAGGGIAESWRTLNTIVARLENKYRSFSRVQSRSFLRNWCPAKSWVKYGNFIQTPQDAWKAPDKSATRHTSGALLP